VTFDLLDFHERAVRTPSHESVGEMRELLVATLDAEGHDPRVDDAGNVLATREGDEPGPHLVLNTHVDTVPPHVPYRREGDRIYGRGSCDAKGPLAALLDAFLAVDPSKGRLTLAVTPDEETLSSGAAALDLDADGYVVGEPTGLDVCTAAKGRFDGEVVLRGEAAHAAEPDSGTSAVRAVGPVLDAFDDFDDVHGPGEHDRLGAPTLTATTIDGGSARNQVPARCVVTFDRRSVPPETAEGFRAALADHVRERVPVDVDSEVRLADRETPFLEAFATDPDDPLVRELVEASGGDVRRFAAATEASYFAADAPTVVFGPGYLADDEGAVAHSERECVPVDQLRAAASAVRQTLVGRLG
jgi:acetylornithine deacetylase/succinyl-diaminopimelate desuccinylase-like protein